MACTTHRQLHSIPYHRFSDVQPLVSPSCSSLSSDPSFLISSPLIERSLIRFPFSPAAEFIICRLPAEPQIAFSSSVLLPSTAASVNPAASCRCRATTNPSDRQDAVTLLMPIPNRLRGESHGRSAPDVPFVSKTSVLQRGEQAPRCTCSREESGFGCRVWDR